jgi:hypothetical membrane protein
VDSFSKPDLRGGLVVLFCIVSMMVFSDYAYCAQTSETSKVASTLGLAGVSVLTASLLFAHALAPETYSSKTNSISELAGQNYKNAWIMRSGFIGFGLLTTAAAIDGSISSSLSPLQSASLGVYGASMVLSGVFSARSFEKGAALSEQEAQLHSTFANLAGIGLTTAMVIAAISENDPNIRTINCSAVIFTLATSALFKLNPEYKGIWQRILWTGSVGWLTWTYTF